MKLSILEYDSNGVYQASDFARGCCQLVNCVGMPGLRSILMERGKHNRGICPKIVIALIDVAHFHWRGANQIHQHGPLSRLPIKRAGVAARFEADAPPNIKY